MKDFKYVIFVLILALFLLQMFVSKEDTKTKNNDTKQTIALSTFSLYDIALHISKDNFEIIKIVPSGVDLHSYEPTPKMMAKLDKSDLVIYNGAGLEPWTRGFKFKNRVINMSKFVELIDLKSAKTDPHYWLDIQNMKKATQVITKEFIKLQPTNKEQFLKNEKSYIAMLNQLDELYKTRLNSCSLDTIVVNHNAFSYLSQKYNFNVESLNGLSADTQATPQDMIRVMRSVKTHKVKVIFFESFASDKVIKSLANELKVEVQTLQPIGNITKDELEQNLTYEDIMKKNLEKISKALSCK